MSPKRKAVSHDPMVSTITTSTGVILRLKQPSMFIVNHKLREVELQKPVPPKVFIEDKGREEEVIDHPDYLNALQFHEMLKAEAAYEAIVATGVEVVSRPDDVPEEGSIGHVEVLEWLGFTLPEKRIDRFLSWMKYIAAPAPTDFALLEGPLLRLMGTPEEEVADSMAIFRREAERNPDSRTPSNPIGGDGNRPRETVTPSPSTGL